MKRYTYIFIVLVGLLLLPLRGVAANADTTAEAMWQQGIESYAAKDYRRAVECFERVAELGYATDDLYYNLGDAYFKLGQQHVEASGRAFAEGELGKAILSYQRALKLNPTMKDARYNLELATDYTNDTEAIPVGFLTAMWRALRDCMSSNGWAICSVVLLFITLTLVLVYLLGVSVTLRKVSFFVALLAALAFVLTTALALSQRAAYLDDSRSVVICSDTTPVHASPDSSSKIIRQPSQGVNLSIVRTIDEWAEVEFADGEKGWIRSSNIERI